MNTETVLRMVVEALVLGAVGAVGLLAKSVLSEIRENRRSVGEIVKTVAEHAQSLRDGNQKFKDINKAIDAVRLKLERVDRDGCTKRGRCA